MKILQVDTFGRSILSWLVLPVFIFLVAVWGFLVVCSLSVILAKKVEKVIDKFCEWNDTVLMRRED